MSTPTQPPPASLLHCVAHALRPMALVKFALVLACVTALLLLLGQPLQYVRYHLPRLACGFACADIQEFSWRLEHEEFAPGTQMVSIYAIPGVDNYTYYPLEDYTLLFSSTNPTEIEALAPTPAREFAPIYLPRGVHHLFIQYVHDSTPRMAQVKLYHESRVARIVYPFDEWKTIYSTSLYNELNRQGLTHAGYYWAADWESPPPHKLRLHRPLPGEEPEQEAQ